MTDLVKISTPIGVLQWVNVSGKGKLSYNQDRREYVASIVLDKDAAKEVIDAIQDVYEVGTKPNMKLMSLGYKPCNKEGKTKDENGADLSSENAQYFIFNFKTNTSFVNGDLKKVDIYNSQAKKIQLGDVRIGNGSLGAISGNLKYYQNNKLDGVSLYLNAIQITKLVEYNEDAGFDAYESEDGFVGVEDAETGFTGQPENDGNQGFNKATPRL